MTMLGYNLLQHLNNCAFRPHPHSVEIPPEKIAVPTINVSSQVPLGWFLSFTTAFYNFKCS